MIHPPGPRLLKRLPLRFLADRATRRRGGNPTLNLVSFIDFLVVTVIFLLMSFSASGECRAREADLASARNVEDAIDAPMVIVSRGEILVDGVLAGSARATVEEGRLRKIEELFALLKSKRELWKQVQPQRPFPGIALLAIDQDTPALVVKSVFQTAAYAGYPNVSFVVHKLPAKP